MEQVKSVTAGILLLAGTVAVSSAYAYSEIADEVGQQGRGFVGLGVGTVPDYEGSDTNEGTVAPFGRYNWAQRPLYLPRWHRECRTGGAPQTERPDQGYRVGAGSGAAVPDEAR